MKAAGSVIFRTPTNSVALAVCGAFHENLARAREGLESVRIDLETVLEAFSLDPCDEILTGGNGNALGIPAFALGIARGGELFGGVG